MRHQPFARIDPQFGAGDILFHLTRRFGIVIGAIGDFQNFPGEDIGDEPADGFLLFTLKDGAQQRNDINRCISMNGNICIGRLQDPDYLRNM